MLPTRATYILVALLLTPLGVLAEDTAAPAASGADQQQTKSPRFNIWEIQVSGNTLLDRTIIEKTVYPFLGEQKSIADVDAASVALQEAYKDAGYHTVVIDIPQQDVSNGVVTLAVVEGKIDRLRITGSRYFSLEDIREGVPGLAKGEVPNLPEVQEQLQDLNAENADRSVTPIFRAGRTPGTVEVELRVKDELPVHAGIEVNGRNSANTSRTRLVGDLRYDNLWQKSHSLSLMFQTAPEETDEVRVFSATYVLPVGSGSDRLALYGISSESDSAVASANALAVLGSGEIVGARWIRPLEGLDNYYHSLTLGADYKDFEEDVVLIGADSALTPIDYVKMMLQYGGNVRGDASVTRLQGGMHFAPRGLGSSDTEFNLKRQFAKQSFAYLVGKLEHEYLFDNEFSVRGTLNAQYAGKPLISNEQFSAGGATSVRGYHESEILGDDGIRLSLELQTPRYDLPESWPLDRLYGLTFIEGAYTWLYDIESTVVPGTYSGVEEKIYGVGVGLRMTDPKEHFRAALDLAWPLESTTNIDKDDLRLHFLLRAGF